MDFLLIIPFLLYLSFLFLISFYFYYKQRHSTDFLLGGRATNYFVTAVAAQAADMSSWLFLGFPAAVYTTGLQSAWIAIGLVSFMALNWHFIAPQLRLQSENTNSLTLSSFLAKRFNDHKGYLSAVSACFALLFFAFYIAAGLVGIGRIIAMTFGLSYHMALCIGLIGSVAYTTLGGFLAVAWCNLFQGLFLLAVIVLVPCISLSYVDNWESFYAVISTHHIFESFIPRSNNIFVLFNMFAWGLGYFGQPHVITYFMGIDDPQKIRYAKYVGIIWQVSVLLAAIAIGLIGLYLFPSLIDPEQLFVLLSQKLFNPLLLGFVLCAIVAASLSTLNSQVLFSASVIAEDLYARFINTNASVYQLKQIARLGSVIIGIAACSVAWSDSNTVFGLVEYAWSGLGSSFGPLVIFSLYARQVTLTAAFWGMVSGGLVAALWPYVMPIACVPLVPGFFTGILMIYVISALTKKSS